MVTKWIQFTTAAESAETFKQALAPLEEASKKEAGCVYYAAYQNQEKEATFHVLESWLDAAAFEAHRNAPHTLAFKEACGSLITGKKAESLTPVG